MITIPSAEQRQLTVKRKSGISQDSTTGQEVAGSLTTIFTNVIGMVQPADSRLIELPGNTLYEHWYSIFFQVPRDVREGDQISWTDAVTGSTRTVRAERINHYPLPPLDYSQVLGGLLSETP